MGRTDLATYLHTIRHLRARQLFYLFLRRVLPFGNEVGFAGQINVNETTRMARMADRAPSLFGKSEFRFLNVTRRFDPCCINWGAPGMSRLWRYNLHYFDYLKDKGCPDEYKIFLINDWIAKNPQGTPVAWEPFPVSLRIVNWIKFFLSLGAKDALSGSVLRSLYEQLLWLEENLEYHLLANHYFKNAKALVFGGLFFSGNDAGRWLRKGVSISEAELEEQVLPDGGHFERSPMYHAMVLEDCLDLYNLCRGKQDDTLRRLSQRFREKARDMVRFLLGMTHPDGGIALFNDAAFGIEGEPATLAGYYESLTGEKAAAPAGAMWSFPDTGYYVLAPEAGTRFIIDCGPVGPRYQPGHSHSDTLSFELSLKGRRMIVDSGCYQYEDGDIRRYNRSGAGHNCLMIDGQDQSEIWGAHRCARRANPLYGRLEGQGCRALLFEGAHDGYRRLPGKPVHHRAVKWTGDSFLIDDRVEGSGRHDFESRLHIHPSLSVEFEAGCVKLRYNAELLAIISRPDRGPIFRTDGWYCPGFGIKHTCPVIAYTIKKARLPFRGGWVIKAG